MANKNNLTVAQIDALSRKIIGAAIAVHKELGPGLLESAYEACLIFSILLCVLCDLCGE